MTSQQLRFRFVQGLFILLLLSVISCTATDFTATPPGDECEAQVDMADSLDFARFHGDCDEQDEQQEAADVKASPGNIGTSGISKSIEEDEGNTDINITTVLDRPAADNPPIPATLEAAGAEVREPFTLSSGIQAAQLGLIRQLSERCPQGWVKQREWVTAAAVGFVLHYGYRCIQ